MLVRNRNHGVTRSKSPTEITADDPHPLDSTRKSHNNRRKSKIARMMVFFYNYGTDITNLRWTLVFGLVVAVVVVLLVGVVHESAYYLALNLFIKRLPSTPYFGLPARTTGAPTTGTTTAISSTIPSHHQNLAIISLHRGYKFAGYLGTWLDGNKAQYAAQHGYRYFNQDDFRKAVLPDLLPWQYDRRLKFDKLRFLLYIFQRYNDTELPYALWLDGDTVIANATISLEDRVAELEHQWWQQQQRQVSNGNETNYFLLAWTSDGQGPNTGVLLLHNCAATRALLTTALLYDPVRPPRFADQESMVRTVQANVTYRDGQLLLTGGTLGRRLQSRVRGDSNLLYHPGDWILHLPNHNRLEIVLSLLRWLV